MEEYQQRVVDEKNELSERLEKLRTFINSERFLAISYKERNLLKNQRVVMQEYLEILIQRIELF